MCVCGVMVNIVRCIFALEMCEVGSRTVMRGNHLSQNLTCIHKKSLTHSNTGNSDEGLCGTVVVCRGDSFEV